MDHRAEVREFLSSRRARLTPERAGLPMFGGKRRVPGLRREEVALLAGVSVDYYARLEKGNLGGVSESVLSAIAGALQLNEAERDHLFDLARAAQPSAASRPRRRTVQVRPTLQRILDSMTTAAAFVRNRRLDVLAANRLGRAMYAPLFDNPTLGANLARFTFLDPRAEDFHLNLSESMNATVALLRTEAGRDPHDRALTDLVGELATQSPTFRTLWAAHNVRLHRSGIKHFHHPVVGDLELSFEALALPADPGLTMTVYTAVAGSPTEDALHLLASWTATVDTPVQETRSDA